MIRKITTNLTFIFAETALNKKSKVSTCETLDFYWFDLL